MPKNGVPPLKNKARLFVTAALLILNRLYFGTICFSVKNLVTIIEDVKNK
jgi:hypothetical protein